ncbi:hypothetical protein Lepto7375DRAFT_8328 [Leptolyngbya sp. PCC 7375]|nr:hypothetical protein Lepto7375DRAFT_8328 [Leptolyngbya sp. PCC 7375]
MFSMVTLNDEEKDREDSPYPDYQASIRSNIT